MMTKTLNVTIVGGGFGGVKAALELSKDSANRITLISDKTHFQYYPALFSTATGHSYRESWVPLQSIFAGHANVTLELDTIASIDTDAKLLRGERSYHYDDAILALGSVTTYFGIEGLDTYAYGIKSQEEIRRLQQHLWNEMSDGTDDEKHYVIIGAGPTGVELAGALGEYLRTLRKHFGIRKKKLSISLIEAAPRVLPRLSEASSRAAEARLRKLGVHVETNKKVERQTADSLVVNGRALKTQTVIWTSGVTNAPFYSANAASFQLNERGKVKVNEYLQAADHVYVIGDGADTKYAGLAQTALHDALFVVKHLEGSTKPYKPVLPPCVIPIGHNWALFEWGKLRFTGIPASIMRSAADMIGYHDVMPIGWAMKAWKAQSVKELRIPETLAD
jgi:NADH dehydrogenase